MSRKKGEEEKATLAAIKHWEKMEKEPILIKKWFRGWLSWMENARSLVGHKARLIQSTLCWLSVVI